MTQIVLIEKNGTVKQSIAKDVSRETLYKKCGYKKPDGFERRTTWSVVVNKEKVIVELWAKDDGKAGMENKYELPPPIDEPLFFGTYAIIRCDKNGNIINLTKEMWSKVYNTLFGGFDDVEEDDEEESEDEMKTISKSRKTKSGYVKDDFVVDDDDDGDADTDEDDDGDTDDDEDKDGDEELDENENDIGNALSAAATADAIDADVEYGGIELEEEEYEKSD
jgi:hypothetical protein